MRIIIEQMLKIIFNKSASRYGERKLGITDYYVKILPIFY